MGIRVPFLDLKRQHAELEAEANAALSRVIARGQFILGREVKAFESEWARLCGVSGAVGVNSGSDALTLALIASRSVNKDFRSEVITSPLTAGYTALAIRNAGLTPVFADVDPHTYTLDPRAMENAITSRTCAIVPVHIYGQMADMDAICEIAARHDLIVIEDAAQAHGAQLGDKRAGAHGHAAAFSFYPTKNLGAYGDAGAVVAKDAGLIERVRKLGQGGHPAALGTKVVGRNSRLDEIQAAVLRVKLRYLEKWNSRRRSVAKEYEQLLSDSQDLILPLVREPKAHVFHLYVVQHPLRDRLLAHLKARGVEAAIHYPSLLHKQTLFRRSRQRKLPVAEGLVDRILSLPLYPQISSKELHAVVNAIKSF